MLIHFIAVYLHFYFFFQWLFCIRSIRKGSEKERIRRLTLQFKEGIMVLASFLSAGYSLENSLSLSVKELEGLYGKQG